MFLRLALIDLLVVAFCLYCHSSRTRLPLRFDKVDVAVVSSLDHTQLPSASYAHELKIR